MAVVRFVQMFYPSPHIKTATGWVHVLLLSFQNLPFRIRHTDTPRVLV